MENAAAGFANLALNAGSMTFRMVLVAMVAAAHAHSASEATLACFDAAHHHSPTPLSATDDFEPWGSPSLELHHSLLGVHIAQSVR